MNKKDSGKEVVDQHAANALGSAGKLASKFSMDIIPDMENIDEILRRVDNISGITFDKETQMTINIVRAWVTRTEDTTTETSPEGIVTETTTVKLGATMMDNALKDVKKVKDNSRPSAETKRKIAATKKAKAAAATKKVEAAAATKKNKAAAVKPEKPEHFDDIMALIEEHLGASLGEQVGIPLAELASTVTAALKQTDSRMTAIEKQLGIETTAATSVVAEEGEPVKEPTACEKAAAKTKEMIANAMSALDVAGGEDGVFAKWQEHHTEAVPTGFWDRVVYEKDRLEDRVNEFTVVSWWEDTSFAKGVRNTFGTPLRESKKI